MLPIAKELLIWLCRLKVINVFNIYILNFASFNIWHEIHWISCIKSARFHEIWNLLDFITIKSTKFHNHEIHPISWNMHQVHEIRQISPIGLTKCNMKSGRFHETLAKWAKDPWSYFLKSCHKCNKELHWSSQVHQYLFCFFFWLPHFEVSEDAM